MHRNWQLNLSKGNHASFKLSRAKKFHYCVEDIYAAKNIQAPYENMNVAKTQTHLV